MFVFVTFASFNLHVYSKKYKHYVKFNNNKRIMVSMRKIYATKPPSLKNKNIYPAALLYACVIIICSLGQLFRFDKVLVAAASHPLVSVQVDILFWCILAIVQIFSLVYLLRVKVSPLMRYVGFVCSVLVPIFWLVVVIWRLSVGSGVDVGVFGAEVSRLSGVGVSIFMACLGAVLATLSIASIGVNRPSNLSK